MSLLEFKSKKYHTIEADGLKTAVLSKGRASLKVISDAAQQRTLCLIRYSSEAHISRNAIFITNNFSNWISVLYLAIYEFL